MHIFTIRSASHTIPILSPTLFIPCLYSFLLNWKNYYSLFSLSCLCMHTWAECVCFFTNMYIINACNHIVDEVKPQSLRFILIRVLETPGVL